MNEPILILLMMKMITNILISFYLHIDTYTLTLMQADVKNNSNWRILDFVVSLKLCFIVIPIYGMNFVILQSMKS